MPRAFGASTLEEERGLTLEKARVLMQVDRNKGDFWEVRRLEEELVTNFADGSEGLRSDREVALAVVAVRGRLLGSCSEALRGDSELGYLAASMDWEAIKFVSEVLRDDRDFMLKVVRRNGLCLRGASERLTGDREVVLEAVNNMGFALRYASSALQGEKNFILGVVQSFGYTLEYASEELRGDKEVVSAAVHQCPLAIRYASSGLRADPNVLIKALLQGKHTSSVLHFAAPELLSNKDVVLLAARYAEHSEDRHACYKKVDRSLAAEISWACFEEACASPLAVRGEEAPVISLSLSSSPPPRHVREVPTGPGDAAADAAAADAAVVVAVDDADADVDVVDAVGSFVFTATLLSGASFTCEMPSAATTARGNEPLGVSQGKKDLTLKDLAEDIIQKLPDHTEMEKPPRIFLVLAGDQRVAVTMSPWDCHRPLRELV